MTDGIEVLLCITSSHQIFTQIIFFCLTVASEADFRDISNEFSPDELQHLFHNLGISQRDIEHAEKSADTTDTRLKARAVLIWWKKTRGRAATLEALLEAKRKLPSTSGN